MMCIQGLGNCTQGFIDALYFVAFTPSIRQSIIKVLLCRRGDTANKQSWFLKESKNYYDHNLRNHRCPRYSLGSTSPIAIAATQISPSPEPSTSFYESPSSSFGGSDNNHTIQHEQAHNYVYYTS